MGLDCEKLKLFDGFGRPVNLMFNDGDKFKTYCGSFATILMIISLSFGFFISLRDIARGKLESVHSFNGAISLSNDPKKL